MDPRELRSATRAEHEGTEALMPLMGPGLTRKHYAEILATLLPIVKSWETWAAENAPVAIWPLLAPRRRTHMLTADLQLLGGEIESGGGPGVDWATVVGAPSLDSGHEDAAGEFAARFLGAMYVMEGSTLGGRFLAKQVEEELALEPGQGNAYFQGHGEATGAMWREVQDVLRAVPEGDAPLVIAAAKRAFVAFGDALRAGKSTLEHVQN